MFKKILEKLATYEEQDTSVDNDIAQTLFNVVNNELKSRLGHDNQLGDILFVSSYSKFAKRCAFDLGILKALDGEQEGKVLVDWRLAKQLLDVITEREVQRLERCKTCKQPLGDDRVKMRNIKPTCQLNLPDGKTADVWDVWAFCQTCAETAGPEWTKINAR